VGPEDPGQPDGPSWNPDREFRIPPAWDNHTQHSRSSGHTHPTHHHYHIITQLLVPTVLEPIHNVHVSHLSPRPSIHVLLSPLSVGPVFVQAEQLMRSRGAACSVRWGEDLSRRFCAEGLTRPLFEGSQGFLDGSTSGRVIAGTVTGSNCEWGFSSPR
jgi:hypothetical protein